MFLNAKNGQVVTDNTTIDYISFGKGKRILVLLPGVGEGLISLKGKAFFLALAYKMYAKDYRVFIFSRKKNLPRNYSTRDMARDQAKAMDELKITSADVIGVSQGGMIAQWLAIDYPQLVCKLVLVVSSARSNEKMKEVLNHWFFLASQKDYQSLMMDNAEKSYSEAYLKKYRFFYPLLGHIGKPKNFERFLIQVNACLSHNSYPNLSSIFCETLIIGGENDQVVGKEGSIDLKSQINKSELVLFPGLGHALYDEAKDFNPIVLEFLGR